MSPRADPPMRDETCPCCFHTRRVYDVPPHPEDVQAEADAKKQAARVVAAFVEKHRDELAALVETYADRDAHVKLNELREAFWGSEEWFP